MFNIRPKEDGRIERIYAGEFFLSAVRETIRKNGKALDGKKRKVNARSRAVNRGTRLEKSYTHDSEPSLRLVIDPPFDPVGVAGAHLHLLMPTLVLPANQGSSTKTHRKVDAPTRPSLNEGLSCSLSPLRNQ